MVQKTSLCLRLKSFNQRFCKSTKACKYARKSATLRKIFTNSSLIKTCVTIEKNIRNIKAAFFTPKFA